MTNPPQAEYPTGRTRSCSLRGSLRCSRRSSCRHSLSPMKLLPLFAVLLLAGCAVVPSTKFTINPSTGVISLDSPKNIYADEINVTMSNGNRVVLKKYSSTNSVDVIASVAAANAQMADKYVKAMELFMSMAEKGALASPRPEEPAP